MSVVVLILEAKLEPYESVDIGMLQLLVYMIAIYEVDRTGLTIGVLLGWCLIHMVAMWC